MKLQELGGYPVNSCRSTKKVGECILLIGKNPFEFSITIEPVKEWNDYVSWHNGIMLFSIDGYIFPNAEIMNICLSCAIPEVIDNLSKIPINKDLFFKKSKKDVFAGIYNLVYPNNYDANGELNYKISPQEFFDRGFAIFAVSSGECIRFLAAKLSYDKEVSRDRLDNITIRETYVSIDSLNETIIQLNDSLNQLQLNFKESN